MTVTRSKLTVVFVLKRLFISSCLVAVVVVGVHIIFVCVSNVMYSGGNISFLFVCFFSSVPIWQFYLHNQQQIVIILLSCTIDR